jgi:hypothetical protein
MTEAWLQWGKAKKATWPFTPEVEREFPNLKDYAVTSEDDPGYNCIAFAAGDTTLYWDPEAVPEPGYYWPPGARRDDDDNEDVEALKRCFAELGYKECQDGKHEPGYRKVALYAAKIEDWTHAAVQQENGEWKSKLGRGFDIQHKPWNARSRPRTSQVAQRQPSSLGPGPLHDLYDRTVSVAL